MINATASDIQNRKERGVYDERTTMRRQIIKEDPNVNTPKKPP